MPRIRPQEFFKAKAINTSLLALLPVCRDLTTARNELRWMREHAINVSQRLGYSDHAMVLYGLVNRRAKGEPLQYIIGTEFVGELEITCRPGVLIPRQETAASVSYLARLVAHGRDSAGETNRRLRILDLCTGTGCIPLLFHHEYYSLPHTGDDSIEFVGVDVSPDALSLAQENLIHQIARQRGSEGSDAVKRTRSLNSIGFVQADVLKSSRDPLPEHNPASDGPQPLLEALDRLNSDGPVHFDILISNPPYISPKSFLSTTSRSVRKFEPPLALVPSAPARLSDVEIGDYFYPRLLEIAEQVTAKAVLFEVADFEQAERVARDALLSNRWSGVEIWRDDPAGRVATRENFKGSGRSVLVRGKGNGRSVVAYRSEVVAWFATREHDETTPKKAQWPDLGPDR